MLKVDAPDTILIIEDDESILETIQEVLEWEGYDVVTAKNGSEALQLLGRIPAPDLIILDMLMPVMNGWEFLNALEKTRPQLRARVPILISSACSPHNKLEPHAVPLVQGVIPKPFELDHLIGTVRKWCGVVV